MIGTFLAAAVAVGLGLADEGYRHVFLRGEGNAVTRPAVRNFAKVAASNVEVRVTQLAADGKTSVFERTVSIGDMEPGDVRQFAMPVETRFRPGPFKARLVFHSSNNISGETVANLTIAPALRKDAMPAVIWGSRGSPDSEPAELGFTHGLLHGIGWMQMPKPNSSKVDYFKRLDDALACGFKKLNQLVVTYPSGAAERNEKSPLNDKFMRRSRKGEFKVRPWGGRTPEVGQPELIEHAKKLATASAEDFGDHPAFGGVLPVSERRDTTFPSFNTEHLRYKAETGFDVPDEVLYKVWSWGACKKRFPDGIVDEDDPVIRFYKWFWNHGDGWPGYATAIADTYRETMKKYNRPDFFSFWDPAVRTPYVWGSGGNVDYLNQWVYAIPEPMNIAGPTEEMFAMVKGRPGQQVMMMTQLICYRKEIAPTNFVPRNAPEWLSRVPKANFPTIPPDMLTEAVWTMLSKPVKGVMFHGWGTISPTLVDGYRSYTCPATRVRIGELMKGPVRELGPMLLKLGREPSEVVVHDSGITSIVDGPAQWGWRNVNALRVMNARLDPRIVFDEEIVRDGLGNAKVLYLWGAWFMTKPVLAKIRDFQSRGGIVVGEEDTLKAITPDIKLPLAKFSAPKMDTTEWNDAGGNATSQKATMAARNSRLEIAERLRMELAAKGYESKTGSSSPEIVTFNRQWKDVPYLFAINDKRGFGDYVGQWGLVMEKGLPNSGTVHLRDPGKKVAAVYELSRGGEVQNVRRDGDRLVVPVSFDSNDARFFAFLPEKIKSVALEAVVPSGPGGNIDVRFSVLGESGRPVHALLPVEIRVYDSSMREIDGAGWTVAEDGVARLSLPLNLDDPPGDYTVVARDRASGLETSRKISANAMCAAAHVAEIIDANALGFDPAAEPSANAAALQKALDGGNRKVVVSKPGIYGLDRTVFIDSNTELEFAKGVVLQKRSKYANVLVNRGAYNFGSNENITVRGLEISVNGFQMIPPANSPAKNLRGQLAFYHAKHVRVYDFRCVDLANYQYCVHFVGFEDVLVDGFEIRGKKDGIHFNSGRGFVVRNGVACTCDDALAVNAGDWPDCAPEMGSLEDGLFENIRFLPTGPENAKKPGELVRLDACTWPDWHPGIRLQRNDTVRVGKNVYAISPMPFVTNETVSLTCPTHTNGVWKSPEGINFLFLQSNGANRCDVRNVTFRNIHSDHPVGALVTWETGSAWCRAIHPEIKPEDYPVIDATFEDFVMTVPGRPAIRGIANVDLKLKNVTSAGSIVSVAATRGLHGPHKGMRGRIVCTDCAFSGPDKNDFEVTGDCDVEISVNGARQTRDVQIIARKGARVKTAGDARIRLQQVPQPNP